MSPVLLLVAGLVVLVGGAELLVRGAARLAAAMGVSSLVIGLTVVAYGTSAPELAVSSVAAVQGRADIALGNVVGSNILNVLVVLGASALIAPLVVSRQLVRIEVPLMIGVSVALLLLGRDGRIGRIDGLLLLAGAITYTAVLLIKARRNGAADADPDEPKPERVPWASSIGLVIVGLGLLVLGADWLVRSATAIARALGMSELVIGLTVVAVGTSLPELATSLTAAFRGERDMAVGNVIGSNLFNILFILGVAGILNDVNVAPAAQRFDIPVMIAVAVACLPVFFTRGSIGRGEGAMFLLYYLAYMLYVLLYNTGHDALPAYSRVMLIFVLPLTVVSLVIGAWQYAWQLRPRAGADAAR